MTTRVERLSASRRRTARLREVVSPWTHARGEAVLGTKPEGKGQGGFTLVETCVTMVSCVVMLLAFHAATRTSIDTRREVQSSYVRRGVARDFVARLRRLPFGNDGDAAVTASQLTELFDADEDLGGVTLHQLKVRADLPGHTFQLAGEGVAGTWSVRVTGDLNGDGDTADDREGRGDLLRLEVTYEGRLVLETVRTGPSSEAVVEKVDYIVGGVPEPPADGVVRITPMRSAKPVKAHAAPSR